VSSALAVRSSIPPAPAATIERPRLLATLDAHRGGAFTLVSAPPGWGKSVLLSAWAADRGAAWLTLGTRHCDAHRLWADIIEALSRAEAPIDEPDVDPFDDDMPIRLADALAGAGERPVLVLDDLHLLRGPALTSLGELLIHGRDALHVVAATRSDPHLPLERLACPAGSASCARRTSRSPCPRRRPCWRSSG
jgi:LuxR family maltose regulon positive regulatory protein